MGSGSGNVRWLGRQQPSSWPASRPSSAPGGLHRPRPDDQSRRDFAHDIRAVGTALRHARCRSDPPTARCMTWSAPMPSARCAPTGGLGGGWSHQTLDLELVGPRPPKVVSGGPTSGTRAAKRAFMPAAEVMRRSGGQVAPEPLGCFCRRRHRQSFLELVDAMSICSLPMSEIMALYAVQPSRRTRETCGGGAASVGRADPAANGDRSCCQGSTTLEIEPYRLGPLVTPTGAGDLMPAGFLFGHTRVTSLETLRDAGIPLCRP